MDLLDPLDPNFLANIMDRIDKLEAELAALKADVEALKRKAFRKAFLDPPADAIPTLPIGGEDFVDEEVARYLLGGISIHTLRHWRENQEINTRTLDGVRYYAVADIIERVERRPSRLLRKREKG